MHSSTSSLAEDGFSKKEESESDKLWLKMRGRLRPNSRMRPNFGSHHMETIQEDVLMEGIGTDFKNKPQNQKVKLESPARGF